MMKVMLTLLVMAGLASSIFGQQRARAKVRRVNPDGWFSLLVPTSLETIERHADVDGGFYLGKSLEIDFDYWTYENTPNSLRDAKGLYSKRPILPCRGVRGTVTERTKVGGRSAIVQTCRLEKHVGIRKYSRLYYLTFPNTKIFDGKSFRLGMLSLSVSFSAEADPDLAKRIAHSLRFSKK